jgi:hypothetical protein
MDARQREYDRFGPWAIEVTEEDPVPPIFVPHLTRPEPALLTVKIPRRIERRNARPGMDLYDYLVCLYEEDVLILQRLDHDVRRVTFRYRDVQYLRVDSDLLRGNLHLGIAGRPCDLPYNTVSGDLMLRVADLIRERYALQQSVEPATVRAGGQPAVQVDDMSFYFDRLLRIEAQEHPGMRLLAAQSTVPVATRGLSAVRRLLFSIADKRLLESMHLTDGHELKVIGRGQPYAYRWQAIYGTDTCFIPIANLRSVSWQDDARNAATDLELGTSGGSSHHVFTQDNTSIEPYAGFLASRCAEGAGTAATSTRSRPPA